MKVLWFTNNPSNATKKLSPKVASGGWMHSLENNLKRKTHVELGVVFHWSGDYLEEFNFENTRYFPVNIGQKSKFRRYKERFFPDKDDRKLVDKYINIVATFKPDIIHIHGTENAFGLVIKYTKIPNVLSIQGNRTVYTHKHFSGLSVVDLLKYTNPKQYLLRKSYLQNRKRIYGIVEREQEIFHNVSNILGRTDWDRRITKILAPRAKYHHGDEVLRNKFFEKKWEFKDFKNLKLFTTMAPNIYKGLETIVETCKLLNDINIKFEWKIAGLNGKEQICEIVKKKYKINFQELNLSFLGKKIPGELVEEMLDSTVFVHPSHIDNSPNSVCEAMLVGMPVISTFTGGTGSLLTDKHEGLLIQDGDPWSMAGAIIELYNNKQLAIQMGNNARIRALKRHDPDRIVNDLMNTYEQIIQEAHDEKMH